MRVFLTNRLNGSCAANRVKLIFFQFAFERRSDQVSSCLILVCRVVRFEEQRTVDALVQELDGWNATLVAATSGSMVDETGAAAFLTFRARATQVDGH